MAGFCAFLCPGLGHLVLGKPFQALLWLVLIVTGYVFVVIPGLILHILSIVDAARAERRQAVQTIRRAYRR